MHCIRLIQVQTEVCVLCQGRLVQWLERPPMTYDWSESWTGDHEFDSTIFQKTLHSLLDYFTVCHVCMYDCSCDAYITMKSEKDIISNFWF